MGGNAYHRPKGSSTESHGAYTSSSHGTHVPHLQQAMQRKCWAPGASATGPQIAGKPNLLKWALDKNVAPNIGLLRWGFWNMVILGPNNF